MLGKYLLISALLLSGLVASPLYAAAYPYSSDETVIGTLRSYQLAPSESLLEVARDHSLGYGEITAANPGLDPFLPGAVTVMLPTSWILPEVKGAKQVVINISEMRLYYYISQQGTPLVMTFPIGIGSEGTNTPVGSFRVIEKMENPPWHVPASIRREHPELPAVVPPGPENPLGSHALRLSLGDVLIHSTNRPWGIGRKATHGCIRLYPEDMPGFYRLVPVGAVVTIIRQPVKVGVKGNRVYIEVHKDDGLKGLNYLREARRLLEQRGELANIDWSKLRQAARELRGLPVDISVE